MIPKFATISAKDARIHWKNNPGGTGSAPSVYVGHRKETYDNPEDLWSPVGCKCWTGAGNTWWSEFTDAERLATLSDLAIFLIIREACDPNEVIRQFCKIEEFFESGSHDRWKTQIINMAVTGKRNSGWPPEI